MIDTNEYIDAYYIDPENGNDDNSGTKNSPFKTIQQGVDVAEENDNDGNKVYLTGGTYYLDRPVEIFDYTGEENAPLTIQSAPEETAILDGSGLANQRVLIDIKNASLIDIADLEIRNTPTHGIEVTNGEDINIHDNLVHNTGGMGIRVRGYMAENAEHEGDTTVQSSNVVIARNGVFQTNLSNSGASKGTDNWGAGIQAWNADEVMIVDNTVGENYGEGIGLSLVDNGTVANNYLYDNYSVQIYLDNATDSLIKNNFTFNSGDRRFFQGDNPANGIALANEIHNVANPERFYLDNNIITENIVVNASTGISYGTWAGIHQNEASDNWRGLKNTEVSHNTIYNSAFHAIRFYGDDNIDNVNVSNNIFYQESEGYLSRIDNLTGLDFQSNVWFGEEPESGFSQNDVVAKPLFVNPGGDRVADYQIQQIDTIGSNATESNSSILEQNIGAIEGGDIFATGEDSASGM